MLLRTIRIHRICGGVATAVSTTSTSLHSSVLLSVLIAFSPLACGPAVKRAGGPAELQTGSLCDSVSVKLNVPSC